MFQKRGRLEKKRLVKKLMWGGGLRGGLGGLCPSNWMTSEVLSYTVFFFVFFL